MRNSTVYHGQIELPAAPEQIAVSSLLRDRRIKGYAFLDASTIIYLDDENDWELRVYELNAQNIDRIFCWLPLQQDNPETYDFTRPVIIATHEIDTDRWSLEEVFAVHGVSYLNLLETDTHARLLYFAGYVPEAQRNEADDTVPIPLTALEPQVAIHSV